MLRHRACLALAVCLWMTTLTYARSGFLLTLPQRLYSGSTERLCLTLHDIQQDVDFYLRLQDVDTENTYASLHRTFHAGSSHCFDLVVPRNISTGEVKVLVEGGSDDGYSFNEEALVDIATHSYITFIQTDKPVYKPEQTVRFRILSVSPDLRPLIQNIPEVWVKDASGVRVIQWTQVEGEQGLVSLEFPLSNEPVLGTWTIEADIAGQTETQEFKVDEYVLPKYEVVVNPAPYVLINAETIEAEVCAKYTYGKPVEGNLTVRVCVEQPYYNPRDRPCALVNQQITGCSRISVNADDILLSSNHWSLYKAKVAFHANVTETVTGMTLSESGHSPIERDVLRVNLADHSPNYFKPGLPFHGKGVVTHPDGTPAAGVEVVLHHNHRRHEEEHSYTTDEQGTFLFTLPAYNINTSVTIRARLPGYDYSYRPSLYVPYTPTASLYLKPWFSPSQSFLQIEPLDGHPECGEEVQVNVVYTTPLDTNYMFYYQVMSRGNIVWSGHKHHHFQRHDYEETVDEFSETDSEYTYEEILEVQPPPSDANEATYVQLDEDDADFSEHTAVLHINVPVLAEMSPTARLLVYYIREDGETIADSREISLGRCLNNQVDLSLSDDAATRLPGEATDIRLRAAPESLCSIGVVDKSVHLLGGKNQLTLNKVFSLLAQYDLTEETSPFMRDTYCSEQLADDEPPMPWDVPGPPGGIRQPARRRARRSYFPGGHAYSNFFDSSKAFKLVGMAMLTDTVLESRPCERHRGYIAYDAVPLAGPRGAPGENNLLGIEMASIDTVDSPSPSPAKTIVDLRNYFPETWLWELHNVGASGEVNLRPTVPHTLTTWMGSAVCTNLEAGLGVSGTASVTVFQPFFTSLNLPYSVIRGENVPLSVTVFNYLTECLVVHLTLKPADWFDIDDIDRQTKICVCGNQATTHEFHVVPTQIGENNVTIKAESVTDEEVCGNGLILSGDVGARDAVTRKLLVEAEGVEDEYSLGSFVCPADEGSHSDSLMLELPPNVVADSARGYFTVIGDAMGPALSGLDKLIKLPTGCGEQNMLKFAPNIYVLQYLTNTEQLQPELSATAHKYLLTGYQRELGYRHTDGSYSAFGNSDPEGSTWLTAFVLKSFAQARHFISIDEADLNVSQDWLAQQQLENGCFPRVGRVLHKAMKGGLSGDEESPATLTAYVLAALIEAGVSLQDPMIQSGMLCMVSQDVSDVYTLALSAYMYALYDPHSNQLAEVLDQLDQMAIRENGMVHWSAGTPAQSSGSGGHHQAASADVELTAYVLLSKMVGGSSDAVTVGLPIVKWLTQQRNGEGGFSSTQDTVVALHALSQYAALVYGEDIAIDVSVTGVGISDVFSVTNDNSLLQFKVPVDVPNTLAVTSSGQGCVFVQATVKYNVQNTTDANQDSFALRVNLGRLQGADSDCRKRTMSICTRYLGEDGASNMAVVAVKMVSGWIPVKNTIKQLMTDEALLLKRYEIEQNWIHFYFDELTEEYKCLDFEVEQDMDVGNAKPGFVQVYDYYQKDLFSQSSYSIRPVCGTKEELPNLTPEEFESANNPQDPGLIQQHRVPIGESPFGAQSIVFDDLEDSEIGEMLCPVCLSARPDNLEDLFCQAQYAYKVELRPGRQLSVKILADLRPPGGKIRHRLFGTYTVPSGCQCASLTEGTGKVLVLTKETTVVTLPTDRAVINTSNDFTIIPMADTRGFERDLRMILRNGRCTEF